MHQRFRFVPFLMLVLLSAHSAQAQIQLPTKRVLTLEAAKLLAKVASAEATKNGWTMVFAVVDDGGNLVYLERMDNAQTGSIEVAIQKAKTAISFKRPTKTFEDRALAGRTVLLALPGVVPIEGGVPIIVDGQHVGALGVSGGLSEQDGVAAQAALNAFSAR